MPYTNNNELPPHVKKLSKHFQNIWRNAFNSAYKQYDDEGKAFMVANSAIKKYRESHSKDYNVEFDGDINKFLLDEKKEKERKSDYYGNDFTNNIDDFLKG